MAVAHEPIHISKVHCSHIHSLSLSICCSGVDASIALFLLYRFRFLERHMGSRKFGTLALLTVSMTALYIAILLFFRHHRFPIPNGCYSFLGVIAFHFHRTLYTNFKILLRSYNLFQDTFQDSIRIHSKCLSSKFRINRFRTFSYLR